MTTRFLRAVAVVGATTIVGAGGAAYAQSSGSGSYPGGNGSASGNAGQHHGKPPKGRKKPPPKLTAEQIATIAGKLGVSTDALKAAMEKAKPPKPPQGQDRRDADEQRGSSTEERPARPDPLAVIAQELGKTTAEVKAAFDSVRPAKKSDDDRPARAERS